MTRTNIALGLLLTALTGMACFDLKSRVPLDDQSTPTPDAAASDAGCPLTCGVDEHCSNQICCPAHHENCGGGCVDVLTDVDNCGFCKAACPSVCAGGKCCFFPCATNEMCDDGMCKSRITHFLVPTPPPQNGAVPQTITTGPDGNLWFTAIATYAGEQGYIGRMSTDGDVTLFPVPVSPVTGGAWDITVGPDGNLWFTVPPAGRIGKITTTGELALFGPVPGAFVNQIAAGPDGNLWFTHTPELDGSVSGADTIGRITTSGDITEFPISAYADPQAITAGPDGNMWFTENSGNAIGRITSGGQVQEFPLPSPMSFPSSIVVGPDGALWFSEVGQIGRITVAGEITEVAPHPDPAGAAAVLGADGNLWGATQTATSDSIVRMSVDGQTTDFELAANSPGVFDLTMGPDGNLWFTEYPNGTIGRLTLP